MLKVKVPCSLVSAALKAYRGVEIEFLAVLTSAVDRDELSASWPGRFTARRLAP